MTVIDLGEVGGFPATRPPRPRPRMAGRPLRTVVVLLLVLVTLAGAAPAPGRIAATVPGSPLADAFLVGDLVVVADPVDGVSSGVLELTAYPLPERPTAAPRRPEPRWRVRLPLVYSIWGLHERDGMLLVTTGRGQGEGDTIALRAATGQIRWRQSGVAGSETSGPLLLKRLEADGRAALRAVRPDSGEVVWSLPDVPQSAYSLSAGAVDRVVLIRPGGEVEVRDPLTRMLLRHADLRPGAPPAELSGQVVDGLLVLADERMVTAHDLDGLERRWALALPAMGYVERCATLLCVHSGGNDVRAVDPATGALRWRTSGWDGVVTARSGRLLVVTVRDNRTRYGVLDAGTGRQMADLGDWRLLSSNEPDNPLLGIRPGHPGRLALHELDLVAARFRLRDMIPDVSELCQAGPDAVLCRRLDGSFGVWRWPR
ncbi:outer membrane protein assembly factor BamB family protein [Micromonospora sp. URMC 103]|uniref:outer membrane protein assembly factor BamB family protein n=1 Tax=Micromonospora sp. URMC 103 TaxID=3423406 RepID=UPI003F1D90E5